MKNNTIRNSTRFHRPLKICVVTQQLRDIHSGPGLHAQNLLGSLINDGHMVTLLAPQAQVTNKGDIEKSYAISQPKIINNQAQWLFTSFSINKLLQTIEKKDSFDLIHFTDFRDGLFCETKAPSIANINDTYTIERKGMRYYRQHYNDWLFRWLYYHISNLLERKFINRFDVLLANSRYTKEKFISEYPFLKTRTHVIYKSIDPGFFKPAIFARKEARDHSPRILFIGSNMQRKGVPDLLKAAPRVIQEFPDCEFWIVGNDKSIPELISLTERLGIKSKVTFWGKQDRFSLLNLFGQADLFTMPSLIEAFGVVFLEAMASGLPIVATNVGGIPELIQDKFNGVLVPPNNPALLASGMLQILNNRNFREQLSKAGIETVKKYTVERMMHETYNIYSTLL